MVAQNLVHCSISTVFCDKEGPMVACFNLLSSGERRSAARRRRFQLCLETCMAPIPPLRICVDRPRYLLHLRLPHAGSLDGVRRGNLSCGLRGRCEDISWRDIGILLTRRSGMSCLTCRVVSNYVDRHGWSVGVGRLEASRPGLRASLTDADLA